MEADLVGLTIGNYRLERQIGAGKQARVFSGRHVQKGHHAAVKVIHAALAQNPDIQKRFKLIVQDAALLQHPNIIRIGKYGDQDRHLSLVTELAERGSLRPLLKERRPLSLALAVDLARQAADALDFAHAQNSASAPGQKLVHGGIHPDNLLLYPDAGTSFGDAYRVKLSDFGMTRLEKGTYADGESWAYMSPEQCRGMVLDGRSDIYSLGVVLYEVVTGYLPFQAPNRQEVADKHLNAPPPRPRAVRSETPAALEEAILRCLAKNPADRFETAGELSRALREIGKSLTRIPLCPPLAGESPLPRLQVLDQDGQRLQVIELSSNRLTVGRDHTNDLVLPSKFVSGVHLRIHWDGSQMTATDLRSRNGTRIGGTTLPPEAPQSWPPCQILGLGTFWLCWEPPTKKAQAPPPPQVAPPDPPPPAPAAPSPLPRLAASLNEAYCELTPGQPAVITLTLSNKGQTVDWLSLSVEGVPQHWVKLPDEAVKLNPGTSAPVALPVHVPKMPESRAKDYQVTIRARSRHFPDDSAAASASWRVLPFLGSRAEVAPEIAEGRRKVAYTLTLRNEGNAPAQYTLNGRDGEKKLTYRFASERVSLEPGQSKEIPFTVSAPWHWVGNPKSRPFKIEYQARGDTVHPLPETKFQQKALVPAWLTPVAVAALMMVGTWRASLVYKGQQAIRQGIEQGQRQKEQQEREKERQRQEQIRKDQDAKAAAAASKAEAEAKKQQQAEAEKAGAGAAATDSKEKESKAGGAVSTGQSTVEEQVEPDIDAARKKIVKARAMLGNGDPGEYERAREEAEEAVEKAEQSLRKAKRQAESADGHVQAAESAAELEAQAVNKPAVLEVNKQQSKERVAATKEHRAAVTEMQKKIQEIGKKLEALKKVQAGLPARAPVPPRRDRGEPAQPPSANSDAGKIGGAEASEQGEVEKDVELHNAAAGS